MIKDEDIRYLRESIGETLVAFGQRVGVIDITVFWWEKGKWGPNGTNEAKLLEVWFEYFKAEYPWRVCGDWIRDIRKRARMNQKEFGMDMMGVLQDTIHKWERGHHPPNLNNLKRLRGLDQVIPKEGLNGEFSIPVGTGLHETENGRRPCMIPNDIMTVCYVAGCYLCRVCKISVHKGNGYGGIVLDDGNGNGRIRINGKVRQYIPSAKENKRLMELIPLARERSAALNSPTVDLEYIVKRMPVGGYAMTVKKGV